MYNDHKKRRKMRTNHPGRKIHENVFTLQLLTRNAKRKKSNMHALFLDYSKAFDRVNHYYLLEVLKRKNFGERTIKFIESFLGGRRSVDFNGYMSDEFGRGVPQGETLSPFLFALALDPLIAKIQNDNSIQGIPINENMSVKLLAYADDLVFLSENKEDLERMMEWSKVYEGSSNASLSTKKSELISFGEEKLDEVKEIKRSKQKVRHLGFFVNKDGIINNLNELMMKALNTLHLLKSLFPHFTKKVNLVKGYFYSAIQYQSPILSIKKGQSKLFHNVVNWFLFHNKSENKQQSDEL